MTENPQFSKNLTSPRVAALLAVALLAGCVTAGGTPANRLAEAARTAEAAHDYAAATTHYASWHEAVPDDPAAAAGLARSLRHQNRADAALKILEESLGRLGPKAPLLVEQGKAAVAAGRADLAVAPLNQAAQLDPKDWQAPGTLGIAYDQLERYAEAAASYRQARALAPDNVQILNNLALSLALSGNLEGGLTLISQAAAMPAAQVQVHENLALLRSLKEARAVGSIPRPAVPVAARRPARSPVAAAGEEPALLPTAPPASPTPASPTPAPAATQARPAPPPSSSSAAAEETPQRQTLW